MGISKLLCYTSWKTHWYSLFKQIVTHNSTITKAFAVLCFSHLWIMTTTFWYQNLVARVELVIRYFSEILHLIHLSDSNFLPSFSDPFWVITGEPKKIPNVFVAGDAFPFTKHCMKPYGWKNLSDEERVFYYCCSRFWRITENAFAI